MFLCNSHVDLCVISEMPLIADHLSMIVNVMLQSDEASAAAGARSSCCR